MQKKKYISKKNPSGWLHINCRDEINVFTVGQIKQLLISILG